ALKPWPARCTAPVVVGVAVTVQRRRHGVVEFPERARRAHLGAVIELGKQRELGERLRLQRGEEMARIDLAVDAAIERAACGAQVDRRGNGGGAARDRTRLLAALAEPFEK